VNSEKITIISQAWETYQNIISMHGETTWKIRTIGLGFWAAMIAYGYQNSDKFVFVFSIIVIVLFLIIEAGVRQLQNKYIHKSIEIERALNDYIAGEKEMRMPSDGISTDIEIPDIGDLWALFQVKRWMFWFPYLIMLVSSLIMIIVL